MINGAKSHCQKINYKIKTEEMLLKFSDDLV